MRELLAAARGWLAGAGVDNAAWEAEILLGELLGWERSQLSLRAGETLPRPAVWTYAALLRRRAAREPLQHLLGHWPFLELDLRVDARALVPRPETEDLVLLARRLLPASRPSRVADVGTGGGCIALALAHSHRQARILGIDDDRRALSQAAENRFRTGLEGRVDLLRGDLLLPVAPGAGFDLVAANLPYVTPAEYPALQPEVRLFDPAAALLAGSEGLETIRRLVRLAPPRMAPEGWLVLEMAPAHTPVLADELCSAGFRRVEVHEDRFEKNRFVTAQTGP